MINATSSLIQIWKFLLINRDSIQLITSLSIIIGLIHAEIVWFLRPHLEIEFKDKKTFDIVPDVIRGKDKVKWIHLIVRNYGFRRAEDCNGYILRIMKKKKAKYHLLDGFKTDIYIHQHWANEPKGYESQVIEGRRERRLDFCYLDEGDKILKLFTESHYCGVSVVLEPGEYKLLFAVSAKNITTRRRWFYLKWDGTWHGFKTRPFYYKSFHFYLKKFRNEETVPQNITI